MLESLGSLIRWPIYPSCRSLEVLVDFPRSSSHRASHDAEGGWSPPVWISRLDVLETWRKSYMSRLKDVSFVGSFDHRNLYSLFLAVV
ncbi:hypothetical protein SLEP1_g10949 [Rubroshorea leprosula]|uniref:Uncharacterized protein n=1 Tax=Rubroshorea leprosula TaxID=152421 RepID=A0AAV5IE81_9ROSI|nr:hypothetical protein SLEP1_g10949 [Rubroshorea leprosula]